MNGETLKRLIIDNIVDGNQYLFEAIERADIPLCRWLLETNHDHTREKKDGSNILHIGAHTNNVELMELLLQYNCDVNKQNKYGATPVFETQDFDMIKFLIEHGATAYEPIP
jgi:ankyrin repeat protein